MPQKIAGLEVHGKTKEEALQKLKAALREKLGPDEKSQD